MNTQRNSLSKNCLRFFGGKKRDLARTQCCDAPRSGGLKINSTRRIFIETYISLKTLKFNQIKLPKKNNNCFFFKDGFKNLSSWAQFCFSGPCVPLAPRMVKKVQ